MGTATQRRACVLVFFLAGLAPASCAPAGGWIGQAVITKREMALRDGSQVMSATDFRVYTVKEVEGEQLFLVAGGESGWARIGDVVLFRDAVSYYTQEIDHDPKPAWAFRRRGVVLAMQGKLDQAIADLDHAVTLEPENPAGYLYRANTRNSRREFDSAVADYTQAIALDPKFAKAFHNRAVAYRHKKEYGKAIADLTQAIDLDPSYAYAYNGLAWLLATCPEAQYRDGKRAVKLATRACELSHGQEHLATLAAAYAEEGDFDKAIEWQDKSLKLEMSPEGRKQGEVMLKHYRDKKPWRDES